MATIVSLGGQALRCTFGKMILNVFPVSAGKSVPEGTIVLLAHPEEVPAAGMISWPGEYDFNGVSIRGLGHKEGAQVSFVVVAEGIRYAFLSSPLHKFSDFELGLIGDIDVLALPCDDVKVVQELIDSIDPRVLIPQPAKDEKIFQEVLKVCGAQGKEATEEFKVKSLPAEGREVVILKAAK